MHDFCVYHYRSLLYDLSISIYSQFDMVQERKSKTKSHLLEAEQQLCAQWFVKHD